MIETRVWLRYDPATDTGYISFARKQSDEVGRFPVHTETHVLRAYDTEPPWPGTITVDADREGRIVGMSIQGAGLVLSPPERW